MVIMDLSNMMLCLVCIRSLGGLRFYKASPRWAHILRQGVQYPASTAGRQPQTTAQWQSSIPSLYSPQTGGNSDNVTDMVKWYTEHDPHVELWKTKDGNYFCYFSPRIKKLDSLARWATSLRSWCLWCRPQASASDAHVLGLNVLGYLWLWQHFVKYVQGSEAWRSWTIYGTVCWARLQLFHVLYPVQLLTQNHETEWKYT